MKMHAGVYWSAGVGHEKIRILFPCSRLRCKEENACWLLSVME